MVPEDHDIAADESQSEPNDNFDLKVLVAVIIVAVILAAAFFASETGFNGGPVSNPFSGTGPAVSIVPTPGVVGIGSPVALEAYLTGYQPSATVSVAVTVYGPYGTNLLSSSTKSFTTDSSGAGSALFSYPSSFPSGSTSNTGIYTVSASFTGVYAIGTAQTSFTVFNIRTTNTPEVTISPAHDSAGATVAFNGMYFAPNSNITLKDGSTVISTSPSSIKTSANGSFSGKFTVQLPSGKSQITVSDQAGNSVNVPFYNEPYSSSGALVQTSIATYVQSGDVYADLQGPNVVLTVSGSNAVTNTPVTVTASIQNSMSQAIGVNPPATPVAFYDVIISGISSGTATVTITNSSIITSSAVGGLYYWTGQQWTSATNVTVSGYTLSGQIPVSALTGTELVLVPPPPPTFSFTSYLFIALLVVIVIVVAIAAVVVRRRRGGKSGGGKSKGKQQIERMTVSRVGKK